jgi:hypothetical protein
VEIKFTIIHNGIIYGIPEGTKVPEKPTNCIDLQALLSVAIRWEDQEAILWHITKYINHSQWSWAFLGAKKGIELNKLKLSDYQFDKQLLESFYQHGIGDAIRTNEWWIPYESGAKKMKEGGIYPLLGVEAKQVYQRRHKEGYGLGASEWFEIPQATFNAEDGLIHDAFEYRTVLRLIPQPNSEQTYKSNEEIMHQSYADTDEQDEKVMTDFHRLMRDAAFIKGVRKLCFIARTSGGTAGRDEELCNALNDVESMLTNPKYNVEGTEVSEPPKPDQAISKAIYLLQQVALADKDMVKRDGAAVRYQELAREALKILFERKVIGEAKTPDQKPVEEEIQYWAGRLIGHDQAYEVAEEIVDYINKVKTVGGGSVPTPDNELLKAHVYRFKEPENINFTDSSGHHTKTPNQGGDPRDQLRPPSFFNPHNSTLIEQLKKELRETTDCDSSWHSGVNDGMYRLLQYLVENKMLVGDRFKEESGDRITTRKESSSKTRHRKLRNG